MDPQIREALAYRKKLSIFFMFRVVRGWMIIGVVVKRQIKAPPKPRPLKPPEARRDRVCQKQAGVDNGEFNILIGRRDV